MICETYLQRRRKNVLMQAAKQAHLATVQFLLEAVGGEKTVAFVEQLVLEMRAYCPGLLLRMEQLLVVD